MNNHAKEVDRWNDDGGAANKSGKKANSDKRALAAQIKSADARKSPGILLVREDKGKTR